MVMSIQQAADIRPPCPHHFGKPNPRTGQKPESRSADLFYTKIAKVREETNVILYQISKQPLSGL
jgi:hypothetical protein